MGTGTGVEKSSNVRSIERALGILLCFSIQEKELTLTDISQKMDLAKSTTSRLLNTLVDLGFLAKNESTNQYSLGSKAYYLGYVAKENMDLRSASLKTMKEINEITQETVNLYVLDGMDRVCLEEVESPHAIKQSSKIGERFSIWSGATGRSILAFLDEGIWRSLTKELHPFTEKTIVDPDAFIAELKKTREQGYSVSFGEKDSFVGCIAAPILDVKENPIACLAISMPSYRFPEDSEEYASLILAGAKRISREIGYMGDYKTKS